MKKFIETNSNLAEVAGVFPANIAVIYGDKIFTSRQGGLQGLVDLDDLPNWGDVANPREYYLGAITYTPEIDEGGETTSIEVSWGDPLEYGGYCTLYPIKGVEIKHEIKRRPSRDENKVNQKTNRPSRKEIKMKDLRKKIEAKVLGLAEGIVKTGNGDLLVKTVGTKLVHVYNLHKRKCEKYTLEDFAYFVKE